MKRHKIICRVSDSNKNLFEKNFFNKCKNYFEKSRDATYKLSPSLYIQRPAMSNHKKLENLKKFNQNIFVISHANHPHMCSYVHQSSTLD